MKDKSMIDMAGTSMGSGLKMCGSQVGKHMKMGGPKMMGGDKKKGFRESFDANKKAGKKEFKYQGKMYHTKTAEEVAKGLSNIDLHKAFNKAAKKQVQLLMPKAAKKQGELYLDPFENVPGSSIIKSTEEQVRSYLNEYEKRESKMGGAKMMGKKSYGK